MIYTTKPGADTSVTIARRGDTAIVVDTSSRAGSVAGATLPRNLPLPSTESDTRDFFPDQPAGGSSAPALAPGDLDALKREELVIPVAGINAKDLVDSFDDMRGGTRRHNALDIMAARNTPVVAAVTGKVLKMHSSVAGGLTMYQSDPSSRFVMMYGHLESFRPGLAEGQTVNRGEILGFVGTSGNANPTAPHLHFQVTRNDNMKEWWKGTPINPFLVYRPLR